MSPATPQPRTERRSTHSVGNRLMRGVWGLVQATLFRFSPRPLHRWRNWLLRLFGARLHPTARVYPRAKIWAPWNLEMDAYATIGEDVDVYCPRLIHIGANSVVSQYSYLCGATHDFEKHGRPLIPLPITLGEQVWLAADVFVAPGVNIGDGAVVGARSSVFKDLEPWKIYMGSPAKAVRDRIMKPEEEEES